MLSLSEITWPKATPIGRLGMVRCGEVRSDQVRRGEARLDEVR